MATQDDFDQWCDLWNKAVEDGFSPPTKPKQEDRGDYEHWQGLATQLEPETQDEDEVSQDPYYDYNSEELLQEEAKRTTPNPVYPDSVGPDNESPKPAWVNEKVFAEVIRLKEKLYKLEVKVAETLGGGKKWHERCVHPNDKKVVQELSNLRQRINRLSDHLGLEEEPSRSVWAVEQ